ncbi:Germin-like protein 8-2 [Fusarium oxysporum f. sp. albedinis]|nr:Germin-like protein 8-2 [Fusarium oxysporum f. sp. albedinis]
MSMYTSSGGPEADWEVYATTENAAHSNLARRATYNHNTYLTTPLFSATFTATRCLTPMVIWVCGRIVLISKIKFSWITAFKTHLSQKAHKLEGAMYDFSK